MRRHIIWSKLALVPALHGLAAGGVGGQLVVQGENAKLTITYLGNGDYNVTNNATNDSATFHLDGVPSGGAATTVQTSAATTQSSAAQSYTVRAGDTLTKIARRFGVTLTALVAANRLKDANLIRVGQVLTIPGK